MILNCFLIPEFRMPVLNFLLVTSDPLSRWTVHRSKSVHKWTVYSGVELCKESQNEVSYNESSLAWWMHFSGSGSSQGLASSRAAHALLGTLSCSPSTLRSSSLKVMAQSHFLQLFNLPVLVNQLQGPSILILGNTEGLVSGPYIKPLLSVTAPDKNVIRKLIFFFFKQGRLLKEKGSSLSPLVIMVSEYFSSKCYSHPVKEGTSKGTLSFDAILLLYLRMDF